MNKILEINEERLTFKGHRAPVRAITITPDGRTVISGSDDKTIKAWDLKTGQEKFTLSRHSDWVNTLTITPDGKTVISGSDDKTIKTWDLTTGNKVATFTGKSPILS
ncbi:MAG: WD40 repeat domain-containing protein, partial [Dolichospermum sp.]